MRMILSPTKKMQSGSGKDRVLHRPQFLEETVQLWEVLREFASYELESAFRINPQLALQAACDFQDFSPEAKGEAALFSYIGLAFSNLQPETFSEEELRFCDETLRILSGFYGLVRPLDGIQPYRLEMGCKLQFDGKNLYQFWGDKLYRALFEQGDTVLNLASKEYSKAITPYLQPKDRWITCEFLTYRKGKLATVATSAKMARGQMARFIVQNHITAPENVQAFSWDGYAFEAEQSKEDCYVFVK